ncbi:tetratricopeptide repeat protein [Aeoliella sp.]|uniref:tetratricopeptide repeat protein n=1 Tax=Aeoliella sp. TaxID=2795800 RepID=UPI003CCC3F7B
MCKQLWLLTLVWCLPALALAQRDHTLVDDYYNIGNIHQQVSTESEEAQPWFDRGLAMCFGFNHEEAVRCFDKAIAADPDLAIAYAGKAYALGPNFNNMEITREQMLQAHACIEQALERIEHAGPPEAAIIRAIAKRSGPDIPEDFEERGPYNQAYADSMGEVYKKYGDNPNVAEMYAESLMNLQPWKHWTPEGTPGEHTEEIIKVIERAFETHPDHPGLCHMYIHVIEASPTPEKALPAADRLRGAVPGSGHLTHMPTHIDVLLGEYDRLIKTNLAAIEVDKEFLDREGAMNFYTLYRIHNYHFVVYGAMFDGQSKVALDAARAINREVPEDLLKAQVDFLDAFMPTALHVMVRFGQWEEILNEPEPAEYLPMTKAIRLYARTIAYAATDRVAEAEAEREKFIEAVKQVPETSFLFQNDSLSILKVARAMVDGEVAYRKGNIDEAFERLRTAVELDDGLNYDEPWGWMQPARHALGALLAEQGRYAECEEVYREDLERHPKNPWALQGLTESLMKQGKLDEARKYNAEFEKACERADVVINRSCFCRLKVADEVSSMPE